MAKRKVKDVIVNMEDMGLPDTMVDYEVDIFTVPKPKILGTFPHNTKEPEIPVAKSEYEQIYREMDKIYSQVEEAQVRLSKLKELFKVYRQGEDLHRSYSVIFNNEVECVKDDISDTIFAGFVEEYSLDISTTIKEFRALKNLVEAKLMRGKPNYCEVDLLNMSDKKEPVEC